MPRPNLNAPPKWRQKQLELAGAINVGKVKPSDLTNEVSPLFTRDRWEVEDEVYNLLLPSLRLASLWLEVGMPYIAHFLPSEHLHALLATSQEEGIPERNDLTLNDIRLARVELADIAKSTRWQVDHQMRKNNRWLGITRTTPQTRPWYPTPPEDLLRYDKIEKKNGAKRRPLIVGIMGEYVDALRAHKETSEQHLRAAFMAAYTITHEVGHVIWWQDFRSYKTELTEPFVGDDCWMELGFSFGAWIFSGYNPHSADLPGRNWFDFNTLTDWEEHRTSHSELTPWKPLYSVSMEYMELCFTESFWAKVAPVNSPTFSKKARKALKPNIDKDPKPAVSMEIQFGNHADYAEEDDYEDAYEEDEDEDEDEDEEEKVRLVWKRKPYDRSAWGLSKVWDWLTPEDRLWVMGKGRRLIDPSTRVETTGEIKQNRQTKGRKNQGANDTDQEKFPKLQLPTLKLKESPKFESQIEAIVPDQDVPLDEEQLEKTKYQTLVRIRVRYEPEVATTASLKPVASSSSSSARKRERQTDDGDDDDEDGFGSSKKLKFRNLTILEHIKAANPVDEILERWSIGNLERTFTHQKAYEWCQEKGIRFGKFYDNAQWQMGKLNYYEVQADRYLIERIRHIVFTNEQSNYEGDSADDLMALLKLKTELKNSVPNWGPWSCEAHCRDYNLDGEGTAQEILARCENALQNDIKATLQEYKKACQQANLEETLDSAEEIPDISGFEFEVDDYLRYRLPAETTRDDINRTIVKNGLDNWGSAKCKRERVIRYVYTKKTGNDPSRNMRDIVSRTFGGVETYFFTCNLHSSTVGALRSALFIEGRFPHDAELTLLRDFKRHASLDDDSNTLAKVIPYYGEPIIELQLATASSRGPNQNFANASAYPSIYKPRNIPAITNGPVDPTIQRKADIIAGRAVPTVAERMQNVQDFGEALNHATMLDGGKDVLRSHKQAIKSTSGAEILDSLQDIMEVRREFVETLGASEYVGNDSGEAEDDEPPKRGSHMMELFISV